VRSSRVQVAVVLALGASLTLLGGCGKDNASSSATAAPSAPASASPSASASPTATPKPKPIATSDNFDKVTVTGGYGKSPKVTVKAPWAIDRTRTKVLEPSNGPVVAEGSTVEANYYGVNARTGKKFDDSFSRGAPVAFPLSQVVPGFSKGLVGQHQGSRVVIAMPGKDGYDADGGNQQIGVNVGDTLIFVVDITDVPLTGPKGKAVPPKSGLPTVIDKNGTPEITVPKTDPPADLQVQPLVQGTGKKVGANDTITFNYRWVRWSDGKLLEQTYGGKPATAPLSGLLPGLVKGLTGQPVGSRVLLVIPPAEGYPDGNATPSVGPNETLVMVVDLLFTTAGQ
jgi:peptidylprolyl isomerase